MRDIKRIDRILGKIGKIWKQNPDWRFYQLLINMGLLEDNLKLWNIQDEETEEWIDDKGVSCSDAVFRTTKNIKDGLHGKG